MPFTVNDSGDAGDAVHGDGFCETVQGNDVCTLRAAIEETNQLAGPDSIGFDGSLVGAEIQTGFPLTVQARVAIDGCSSQPNQKGPCVGVLASPGSNLLAVVSSGVTVKGLALTNANQGIFYGDANAGLVVQNDWFGIDIDGAADPNSVGIGLTGDSATIGGARRRQRNVFGNNDTGIGLFGNQNTVAGNFFGTKANGTTPAPNRIAIDVHGPNASETPTDNRIGAGDTKTPGVCDRRCNLIVNSQSGGFGIAINLAGGPGNAAAGTTQIKGNFIGLAGSGTAAAPNDRGIQVGFASGTEIGGSDEDANHMAGSGPAIAQGACSTNGITVRSNLIGVAADGVTPLPVSQGLSIAGDAPSPADVDGNTIVASGSGIDACGTGASITGNAIDSGAGAPGIQLVGARSTTVQDNSILDSGAAGIFVSDGAAGAARDNLIGDEHATHGNVISDSASSAVVVLGGGNDRNEVVGNTGSGNAALFVDLAPAAGFGNDASGPNNGLQAPAITSAGSTVISGTETVGAGKVFVYRAAGLAGKSPKTVVGQIGSAAVPGNGTWSVTLGSALPSGAKVSALQATGGGNSTELAPIAVVP